MDSLGASLEAEQKSKAEALRIKKKLESDINELEIALDHSNKANAEGQKAIQRYQGHLRDTIQAFEDEARSRQQESIFSNLNFGRKLIGQNLMTFRTSFYLKHVQVYLTMMYNHLGF
jgi:uncharacterized coiled-coil protein SlyX